MDSVFLLTEDLFEDGNIDENPDAWGERNPEIKWLLGFEHTKRDELFFSMSYSGTYVIDYDDRHLSDYIDIWQY